MTGDVTDKHMRPLKDAGWLKSVPLLRIFAAFKAAGYEIRAVGGAVRNTLLGLPITDIDLATPALPNEIMLIATAAGMGAHPTGVDHGTVTVVADGQPFEVTTLRRDVETDGRHAVVAFTHDWEEDAARRDFTVNAIYARADGSLFDPTGGWDDLKAKRVRFIGRAEDRIREDYLRILRFFRFAAAFGDGNLDSAGLAAATALKSGLAQLSGERVGTEMLKLLASPGAANVVATMHAASVLTEVLQRSGHPGALARLIEIQSRTGNAPDVMARLAAVALDGDATDPKVANALSSRLKLSNDDRAALIASAGVETGIDPGTAEADARIALYRLGVETWLRAAMLAWARSVAATDDTARVTRLDLPQRWSVPTLPIRGADIVSLGVAPGPRVGKILDAFEEWWISAGFPGDPAMQQTKLRALIDQG